MTLSRRSLLIAVCALLLAAGVGVIVWQASRHSASAATPIEDVLRDNETRLMAVDGVVGVGVGESDGQSIIQVYVERMTRDVAEQVPPSLGDYPVSVEVTGPITALPGDSEPGSPGSAPPGDPGITTPTPGDAGASMPPKDIPFGVRGVVTAVTVSGGADQTTFGSILVEGVKHADTAYDKASVRITDTTRFLKGGQNGPTLDRVQLDGLRGKTVEVIFIGPVAESYPVQATAAIVIVLD